MTTETYTPSTHPNLDQIKEWWLEGKRAKEIAELLEKHGYPSVKISSLARYGQRNWNDITKIQLSEELGVNDISDIVDIVGEQGFSVKKVSVNRKSTWGWEKDEDGNSVQVPRETTTQTIELQPQEDLHLEKAPQPTVNIIIPRGQYTPQRRDPGIGVAVSIPDMQIGYYRDKKDRLIPIHDEAAINAAYQVIGLLDQTEGINLLVYQGDNLDLAEFSTHLSSPRFQGTTQSSLNAYSRILATGSAVSPSSEKVVLKGNHEARLDKMLADRMPNLLGLTRVGEDSPVMGIDYLCRFEEYGIQYIDDYPSGEFWVNEGLRFLHGHAVSSGKGSTASKFLSEACSTVFGHIHRRELVYGRKKHRSGSDQFWAASAGTLAKINGEVPSYRTGVNQTGEQVKRLGTEDWQQGIMIIYYEIDGKRSWPEMVPIEDGVAYFRGSKIHSLVDENGNPLD